MSLYSLPVFCLWVVAQKEVVALLLNILFGYFYDVRISEAGIVSKDKEVSGFGFAAFQVESRDFIPVFGRDKLTGWECPREI